MLARMHFRVSMNVSRRDLSIKNIVLMPTRCTQSTSDMTAAMWYPLSGSCDKLIVVSILASKLETVAIIVLHRACKHNALHNRVFKCRFIPQGLKKSGGHLLPLVNI